MPFIDSGPCISPFPLPPIKSIPNPNPRPADPGSTSIGVGVDIGIDIGIIGVEDGPACAFPDVFIPIFEGYPNGDSNENPGGEKYD
jgi:hypothetical protein